MIHGHRAVGKTGSTPTPTPTDAWFVAGRSVGCSVTFTIHHAHDPALASRFDDLALAVSQVEAAELADPVTVAARERVLAFCSDHHDALHRSCLSGHLTGSALVVDATARHTLLLHHAKLDRWLQPGGHADGDGNLASVALKEATEETGIDGLAVVTPAIDIDVHTIPARPGEPEHVHLDVRFLILAPADAEVRHNDESHGARWAPADDPAITGSAELNRAIAQALAVARTLS
jgi:8-oxo-dGTP pyrophosphatase MutT (NUDIX family)